MFWKKKKKDDEISNVSKKDTGIYECDASGMTVKEALYVAIVRSSFPQVGLEIRLRASPMMYYKSYIQDEACWQKMAAFFLSGEVTLVETEEEQGIYRDSIKVAGIKGLG